MDVSFASLLTHIVHIERDVETGSLDDYGQPVTSTEVGEDFRADLQPKSAREIAREVPLTSQAGVDIGDWRIFMQPRSINADDKIVHDSSVCPVPETKDVADAVFELTSTRNTAGRGHHLALDARLIGKIEAVAGS